jgi:hypothetical protein
MASVALAQALDTAVAEKQRTLVADFARRQQQQMLAVAKEKDLAAPERFTKLLHAVECSDWPATSKLYQQIRVGIGQYEGSHPDPALNTVLWQYVLETFGACEQFATWSPALIQRYGDEVLRPLTPNCIFFGGTDAGRFVPTALRATAGKPFHIITQNALADGLYMDFLRMSTDKSVVLPNPEQCNGAFRQFVEDVQAGRVKAGAEVRIKDGRVSVEGVSGVMVINGILAKWIFDENKDKHDFFVEESYVIPWMYPHLAPAGVILKLEKEPLPAPQQNAKIWEQIIIKDFAFWDQLLGELAKQPAFKRGSKTEKTASALLLQRLGELIKSPDQKYENVAQKTFSKLRCASAGLYEFRGIVNAAETAYLQAVAICPESPEAPFRLANLYMRLNRADKATATLEKLATFDPSNKQVQGALRQFKEYQRNSASTNQPASAAKATP